MHSSLQIGSSNYTFTLINLIYTLTFIIDKTIEQGHHLGLTFPDPNLVFNKKTNHYDYSPINWDEF